MIHTKLLYAMYITIVVELVCFSESKYCPMLVKESGITVLKDLISARQWSHCNNTLQLAQQIIDRCERFAVDSDYVTDDEQDIAE